MEERIKRRKLQKRLFIGSVILIGLYFSIMGLNQYITRYTKVCYYMADPPTHEMIVWYWIRNTVRGTYWLEWMLPILLVWTGLFLILKKKNMVMLSGIIGCGYLLSFAVEFKVRRLVRIRFAVNEELIWADGEQMGWEWKIWGIIVFLFFLILPFLKEEFFSKNKIAKYGILTISLILASMGGILLSIRDFGSYSYYILARTIVLLLICGYVLWMKWKIDRLGVPEGQMEAGSGTKKQFLIRGLWVLVGIVSFVSFGTLTASGCIPIQEIKMGTLQKSVVLLVFLGVFVYQFWKENKKAFTGRMKAGLVCAGMILVYGGGITVTGMSWKAYNKCACLLMGVANKYLKLESEFQTYIGYFFLFVILSWVFFFFKMQKMQIFNSVLGIACVFRRQLGRGRFENFRNFAEGNGMVYMAMILFCLAPFFFTIFARKKWLPVVLLTIQMGVFEIANIGILVSIWHRMMYFCGKNLATNLISFFLCHGILIALAVISARVYLKEKRSQA